MKYWFFDGNDVVGPFAPSELVAKKAFGTTSLICPEDFSDDGDHWQPAALFAEVKALLAKNAAETHENDASLEEELDSLLKEHSPLAFDETSTDSPALEIPKKPSKPGPIEDYFNNIKKEDLGDILGIPDPNDDSDMDLAHALAKQLEKTASTRRKQQETPEKSTAAAPVDTAEQTHHVATATEVFGTTPTTTLPQTMPTVPSSTLPTLAAEEKPEAPAADLTSDLRPLEQRTEQDMQDSLRTQRLAQKQTVTATAPATAQTPEKESKETAGIIPNPALLRAEKVEVNSVRARFKQTQEMKDFLNETQNEHLSKQSKNRRKMRVVLLAALAIMIALAVAIKFKNYQHSSTSPAATTATTPSAAAYTQELLKDTPDPLPSAAPAATVPASETQEQKALSIVKNYPLPGNRGTLAAYLNRIYQTQLSQGYTAVWEAEPLHQNTYIVKYRLTKTRKEPIIYVFQADVAANKLTGALNNISLDLVGKI